jgi:alpha-amylase/alpha-mannosidase (GH57 family)
MHQPYYRDPLTTEYLLPWTYLHAVKDYYDMAAIVEEARDVRVVFNLVPSLLEQIEEYAAGTAVDPFLVRGEMAPEDMGEEERLFILENFFSANRQRMIEPYPRYLELLYMAGDGTRERVTERLRNFRDQDILDLQVLFFLAWTGEAARRRYPELKALVAKGKHFTPEDKSLLLSRHREILKEIIPLYRRLHETGKAELSVSPYFHPILPLLCDMKSAHVAMPRATLPDCRFRHPEDARTQIEEGIACFQRLFGFAPAGMWPSEGSVSDEALAIIADCGLQWVATDEGVLTRSLADGPGPGREALYRPHTFHARGRELGILFRDHALSDLIGFTYSQWETERAISDFVARLTDIKKQLPGAGVAPVILDGENAWEYYPDNGHSFLSGLYDRIAATPGLKTATCTEALRKVPPGRALTHIHPGSWINANYGIWVGHPEENRGWDYLEQARAVAVHHSDRVAGLLASGGGIINVLAASAEELTARQVCKSLYAAEGSDWFWWYGDDHFSPHSASFDLLFRRHLMNVYRLLGLDVPRELFEPIKKMSPTGFVREPVGLITPVVNGLVTDYFEWLAAGLYDLSRQSSAMHVSESLLRSFFYGFDRKALYFRIDGVQSLDKELLPGDLLYLHLLLDREYRLAMSIVSDEGELQGKEEGRWMGTGHLCRWKIARVCEAMVPLEAVHPKPGGNLFAFFTLQREEEIGRWPADAPMLLKYAGPDIELENWLI